jgi:hypothetical protein
MLADALHQFGQGAFIDSAAVMQLSDNEYAFKAIQSS